MNLPNKLTVFRAVMVPVFVAVLLIEAIPMRFLWAVIIFSLLSLTDMLDGKIARKRGLITNFGKFLDPLADKMLVISALIAMTTLKTENKTWFMIWIISIIIIVSREFVVSALRLICVEQGNVIAANIFGKIKTATQFVSIILILFTQQLLLWFPSLPREISYVGDILFLISVVATIFSGIVYVIQNKSSISEK